MPFVIYDPMKNGFWKSPNKVVSQPMEARYWKRLSACVTQASIANRGRNVPTGNTPSDYHRDMPNYIVHEYDNEWIFVSTHKAELRYWGI